MFDAIDSLERPRGRLLLLPPPPPPPPPPQIPETRAVWRQEGACPAHTTGESCENWSSSGRLAKRESGGGVLRAGGADCDIIIQ